MWTPPPRRLWSRLGTVLLLSAASWSAWSFRPRPDPVGRARAAYDRRDWPAAAESARAALAARPDDPEARRLLARSLARQGLDARAASAYRSLGPVNMRAEDYALLGRGLLRRGLDAPGLASLEAARVLDPSQPDALEGLAAHWAATGKDFEAEGAAALLARRPGREASAGALLGRLRLRLGDPRGAVEALEGAGATAEEAGRDLATAWLRLGRPDEAARALGPRGAAEGPEASWLRSRIALQSGSAAAEPPAAEPDPLRHEPAPAVGAARCQECHPEHHAAQRSSRHAATFRPGRDALRPFADGLTVPDDSAGVTHRVSRREDDVEVTTRVGGEEFAAIVAYALGSNHQGQSFLAREPDGGWRELRLSRFPDEPRWGRTIEHPARPDSPDGYLGRPISEATAKRCVLCHTTGPLAPGPLGPAPGGDPGISCERCHGPGGNHLLAVSRGWANPAVARPRLARPGESLELCAGCHRAPESAGPDHPSMIRFQAPSLRRSRCFTESRGALGCVTCHDPHRDAERRADHYERKCLACHGAAGPPGPDGRAADAPACAAGRGQGCLGCHMPKVTDVVPRSTFTDHYIRVRSANP